MPLGAWDGIVLPLGARGALPVAAQPCKLQGTARCCWPRFTLRVPSLAWLGATATSWALPLLHPYPEPSPSHLSCVPDQLWLSLWLPTLGAQAPPGHLQAPQVWPVPAQAADSPVGDTLTLGHLGCRGYPCFILPRRPAGPLGPTPAAAALG